MQEEHAEANKRNLKIRKGEPLLLVLLLVLLLLLLVLVLVLLPVLLLLLLLLLLLTSSLPARPGEKPTAGPNWAERATAKENDAPTAAAGSRGPGGIGGAAAAARGGKMPLKWTPKVHKDLPPSPASRVGVDYKRTPQQAVCSSLSWTPQWQVAKAGARGQAPQKGGRPERAKAGQVRGCLLLLLLLLLLGCCCLFCCDRRRWGGSCKR